ncbi:hypothetical protein LP417_22735 [Polaromonas sp. P1-6]|nr:hypothetical protein LP417_22735 [Polaromonas sp. P1-6]
MDRVALDAIDKEVEGYIEKDTSWLRAKEASQTARNYVGSSLTAMSLGAGTSMASWRSRSAKHRRTPYEIDGLK